MVDCTQRGANPELSQKFGIKSLPTVVFVDSEGNEVGRLQGRSAGAVKQQIEQIAKQYAAPTFQDLSVEDGLSKAQEGGKPLGILFTDDASPERHQAMMDFVLYPELKDLRERFVWIQRPLKVDGKTSDEAKELRARKSGTIVLLRAGGEAERLRDRVLKTVTNPKKLKKDMEKALEEASSDQG